MRRATLLICLTLLLSTQSHASAVEVAAEQATELLAKSQALDAKCKFLNSDERDELSSLVARAELSLAQRESVALTKMALARGRKAGNGATCSAAERADISSILVAARTAAAKVPQVNAKAPRQSAPRNNPPQSKASLASYARMTQTYYLARRCGSMSPRAIANFYRTIVRTHHQALSSFGRAAVASVMQQSESKARAQRCS
jgi:hypothetical protein